jgi:hypothetical protein
MNINDLTLGQIKEVAQVAGSINACTASVKTVTSTEETVRVVVLQRGWVVVGLYSQKGDRIFIRNASVVRRWGTTKGVGELAESGPLANTILDKCARPVSANIAAEVLTVECNPDKWASVLK